MDPRKLHCLQAYVNCPAIIEWIKNEAPQGIELINNVYNYECDDDYIL